MPNTGFSTHIFQMLMLIGEGDQVVKVPIVLGPECIDLPPHAALSAPFGGRLPEDLKVARWQNLIPSFPCIVPGWRAWGRNPRKGKDQILQRSGAEP